MTLSRRTLMGSAAAGAALGGTASGRSAQAALDLTAPDNKLEVYRRMRGMGDGELSLWWWKSNIWAKPNDDVAVKIAVSEGLTFQRLTANADGTLQDSQAGRGTFRDAETEEPLTEFVNPINGFKSEPDHIRSLNGGVIGSNGMIRERNERMLVFESEISIPEVNNGQVFVRENFVAKFQGREGRAATSTSSSLTTYVSQAADIADDGAAFRPCNFFYQSLGGFRPWMGMDDATAALSWQTFGQKLGSTAENAPEDIHSWVEANYPGFLENPGI